MQVAMQLQTAVFFTALRSSESPPSMSASEYSRRMAKTSTSNKSLAASSALSSGNTTGMSTRTTMRVAKSETERTTFFQCLPCLQRVHATNPVNRHCSPRTKVCALPLTPTEADTLFSPLQQRARGIAPAGGRQAPGYTSIARAGVLKVM